MSLTKEMVFLQMNKGAWVVNVLDEADYEDIHIKDSINIPLKGKSDDEFTAEIDRKLGGSNLIITHCSGPTCALGPKAATILRMHGFQAEDYPGGIEEWSQAGLPVSGRKAAVYAS